MGYFSLRILRRKAVILMFALFVSVMLMQFYLVRINYVQKKSSKSRKTNQKSATSSQSASTKSVALATSGYLPNVCQPENSRLHPLCKEKFEILKHLWNSTCFKDVHKLDGSDCSILRYLQEIEPYCPQQSKMIKTVDTELEKLETKLKMRDDVEGLFSLLQHKDFNKMKERITELWPEWMEAKDTFKPSKNFIHSKRKKILIYLGAMNNLRWLLTGTSGIMGELVQWADTITTLYVLGHDIKVVLEAKNLKKELQADENGCASVKLNSSHPDLIFTDIMGFQSIQHDLIGNSNLARLRCKMRILDSFGTEAEFNYAGYEEKIPGGRSGWGDLNLHLPQFWTYFPHSPDNTFLGFAAGGNKPKQNKTIVKKNWAVIYGKHANYLSGNIPFIEIIKDYFEIHATMMGKNETLPRYIKNHGVLSIQNLKQLLAQSKVFVGLGFPYEGPGPFDAISQGAVYLNPKFAVPKNRYNEGFFGGKPTLRKVTSQNPYLEDFVGEPHSYTIDIRDKEELKKVLKKIKDQKSFPPYLPREFTNLGLLEKLHVLIHTQNFCDEGNPRWPPLEQLHTFFARPGSSCKDECHRRGMICEPTYFPDINSAENIEKYGMNCNEISLVKKTHSPSYNVTNGKCYVQDHYLYFSCVAEFQDLRRLCPCRTFMKGQTALCQGCL